MALSVMQPLYDAGVGVYPIRGNHEDCGPKAVWDNVFTGPYALPNNGPCVEDAECDDLLFCNGVEICVSQACQAGTDPCPGEDCDEAGDVCVPIICDNNGTCEADEDCNNCPNDCISGGPGCGNGVCEPCLGEDGLSCAGDCRGKQNGKPSNRHCCGDGAEDSTDCALDCPLPVCGDTYCHPGDDSCNCPGDCGAPPSTETNCSDGVDNDCDGMTDRDDLDCGCGVKGDSCSSAADCCSGTCKRNGTCR